MKQMIKRIAVVLGTVLPMIPLIAADVRTNEVNGVVWQYTVTDGKASLGLGTYSYSGRAVIGSMPANLEIPAEIDGCPVVEIANWGFFSLYTELESVTIPEGVTRIGGGAFSSCRALRRVVIPASVTTIDCRYGWYPFGECTSLDEVVFKGDRGAIDMVAVQVFAGTPWLELQDFSLEIKNNRVMGFLGICPSTVTIPEGVMAIGSSAFSAPSATNLVQVVLPESLTDISDNAFYGCNNLQSIHIPANVWSIYSNAFGECVSLAAVTFGREDWLDYYDMMAFKGTPFFDTLPFSLRFEWRGTDEDTYKAYVVSYIGRCPAELDIEAVYAAKWEADRQRELDMSGYDIGEALEIGGIAEGAFASCDIRRVVLPGGLSAMERGAFADCTNLTHVVFSGNAPSEIAEDAFYVYMPEHYNEWGEWVESYYGPNTNCTVYVPATSTGWGVDIPGEWMGLPIRYSASGIVENGVLVSVSLGGDTEYTVPAGVTNIAANAFAGCGELEHVVIPDGVESIDRTAFDGCGKLWANWYKSLASGATDAAGAADMSEIALTVTNVVVHYVTQSVPTDAVVPSTSSGIVNIIGEVTAGAPVAIPSAWAERYSDFVAKFGSDFTAALTKPTGKRDGAGNAMLVWQDFVAGTDPTDDDDVFKASITFDEDGRPVISWTPEFVDPSEAVKRRYRKYGKVRIQDKDWTEFSDGEESNFNFFKVTVEMR
ncbi:MAG: leucine-rich repeat domain-containing protein [Kiritimatiellae bacterium]|nr:leucine-rich repeat domain-containing protein [Kiritimatiellia bacterium]MBQ6141895.1 leucine-rich repeat domain-containing protein [Kiritimatiellia bacterium]